MSADEVELEDVRTGEPLFTVQWENGDGEQGSGGWGIRGPAGAEDGWGRYRTAAVAGVTADLLERAWIGGLVTGRAEPTASEVALAARKGQVAVVVRAWIGECVQVTGQAGDLVTALVLADEVDRWMAMRWERGLEPVGEWRGEGTRSMVRSVIVTCLVEAGARWDPFTRMLSGVRL